MKVKFYNIIWDMDGEDVDLPSELLLSISPDTDIEYEGADALSDTYGWCVEYFKYEVIKD